MSGLSLPDRASPGGAEPPGGQPPPGRPGYHGRPLTTIAPNDFTHLHVHSEFSLLDGLGRITELVDTAAQLGMDSMAITDHGALYGAVAFYQAARTKGIKPIIGVETYVARRSMTDKEGKADAQPFHLILLAQDLVGYRNLCRLVTDAHIDGYYYKPRIDREHLAKYSEGLIGLSSCLSGEIPKALEVEDWELARNLAGEYGDIFGKDRFYLELQDHGMPDQHRLNEQLLRLAPEAGLPLVVTNDLHYVREDQSEAHDVLLCVGTGNNLDTPNRMRFDTHDFYVKSAAQMAALFPDHPEAIANTRRIAEMTDLTLPLGQLRIPHFPVPDGHTTETWLRAECQRGLERRYGTVTPELQTRLDYELGVILPMGYAGYFLIVADFIAFAREQGIQTTCRGSAPGSIVTYTLGITPVDPILYQLPFERFLNPDRVTMPDIDVDFEDGRREEVIAYVGRKYGQDHVAQIITFGTMLARAAIRDVGRVLGHSYGEVDRIAKAVPNQLGIRLDEAIETSAELRGMVEGDPAVKRITDFARHLEGVARNASTHAAGVVISREPLTELMPLQKATNSDGLMSQYEMHAIEALGLLKFDFLGPVEPDDPPPGGRPRPRQPRHRHRPRRHPARRRDDLRAARLGRDDRRLPARVGGHAPLRPRPAPDVGLRPRGDGRALPPGADGQHPRLHPPQARPGGRDLPPPAARAVPGEDLRDLRLPGGHHVRGHRPGRVHRARGGHARLCDPQEEVGGAARAEGEVRHPGRGTRRGRERHRRRVQGVRAVRALRLQQGARDLLRADRLPDRVHEGEPHGRVHDRRADRLPLERGEGRGGRRRVPPDGHRGPATRRPQEPPRVHRRGRRHPVRAAGRQERRAGRHRIDHRGARRGRRLPLADRLLHADRPAAGEPQGARGAGQGRGAQPVRPSVADPARARRRGRGGPGHPARPDLRADLAVRPGRRRRGRLRAPAARPRPRCPSASGCAGRRSCSGCTSRSTRWARSPSGSGGS